MKCPQCGGEMRFVDIVHGETWYMCIECGHIEKKEFKD